MYRHGRLPLPLPQREDCCAVAVRDEQGQAEAVNCIVFRDRESKSFVWGRRDDSDGEANIDTNFGNAVAVVGDDDIAVANTDFVVLRTIELSRRRRVDMEVIASLVAFNDIIDDFTAEYAMFGEVITIQFGTMIASML